MTEDIQIVISSDEALVLFALVARLNGSDLAFEDPAEQRVLWDLESALESALASVVANDYDERLSQSRDRVRDVE